MKDTRFYFLAKQIEKASTLKSAKPEKESRDLKPLIRDDENEPIKLDLQLGSKRPKPEIPEEPAAEEVSKPEKVPRLVEKVESPKSMEKSPEKLSPSLSKITMIENPEVTAKPRKIVVSFSLLIYDLSCLQFVLLVVKTRKVKKVVLGNKDSKVAITSPDLSRWPSNIIQMVNHSDKYSIMLR